MRGLGMERPILSILTESERSLELELDIFFSGDKGS